MMSTFPPLNPLFKTRPSSAVLACAPSNSAADLLAERLLETVAKSDLAWYYISYELDFLTKL